MAALKFQKEDQDSSLMDGQGGWRRASLSPEWPSVSQEFELSFVMAFPMFHVP